MSEPRPLARVEDATLVPVGGPARVALSFLPRASEIAEAIAAARGVSAQRHGRLVVTAVPARLVDAAGRVGGGQLADMVRESLEPAIAAWLGEPPDAVAPAGVLPTSQRPLIMGILNVTPDSFSDGGRHLDASAAIAAGRALVAAGADVVDVGGESTRPGSDAVTADVELERVVPVVETLACDGATVSIDTCKAVVARAAVAAGATIVNDVSAGALDEELLPTVAELGVAYVLMHMRGTPRTMQRAPRYDDVVAEVFDHLGTHLADLEQHGIAPERVVVDPGIGFGKSMQHNLMLLRRLREFSSLGRPVLVGASRKTFLGTLTDVEEPSDRLDGSLAAAGAAILHGARIVRVHDVAASVRVARVTHAIACA